jgi:3-oxoacyl-ACP reductase-like protein
MPDETPTAPLVAYAQGRTWQPKPNPPAAAATAAAAVQPRDSRGQSGDIVLAIVGLLGENQGNSYRFQWYC